ASDAPEKPKEDKQSAAGAGKKLVELIALKHDNRKEQRRKAAEDTKGNFDDGSFKKKIASVKSADGLRQFAKWPKTMPEKLVYVESGKLKPKWPKLKDVDKTKWSEVYKKGSNGKRRLDKAKLHTYVKEQVAKQTTITPKTLFGEDLEGGASITLGQWADNWNQAHQLERRGSASYDAAQIADIELGAGAQLMRFSYGGSLNGDMSVMDRRLSVKAEGHAAVDFAKAEAKLDLFFPRKDGWLWTVTDGDGRTFKLIAGRCRLTVEVSGVVGASIAAELAMKIEVSPLDKNMPKAAGKRGRKGKKARRKQTVSINTKDEADVATLDASAGAFAGVQDWYDEDWYRISPEHDPKGPPTGTLRSIRGYSGGDYISGLNIKRFKRDPIITKKDSFTGVIGPGFNVSHTVRCVANIDRAVAHPLIPAGMYWQQARDYCQWLGEQIGLPFGLPSEAQWEYAARSRGQNFLWATDNGHIDFGRNIDTYDQAQRMKPIVDTDPHEPSSVTRAMLYPVGIFPPNPLGLYDMNANGWEWMQDWYDEDWYRVSPEHDPKGPPTGSLRSIRGYSGGDYISGLNIKRFKRDPMMTGKDIRTGAIGPGFNVSHTVRCVVNIDRAVAQSR
ncbi:formylglycine-generating enzyme family protein, partial [Cupriavidus sp. 2KB_3]|uniref:formylglycine-generating enzyme family protein n=1 Tax=Cupriavidus sp. 2KB_3 TaxID=3232980 RepID=UPI003F90142A